MKQLAAAYKERESFGRWVPRDLNELQIGNSDVTYVVRIQNHEIWRVQKGHPTHQNQWKDALKSRIEHLAWSDYNLFASMGHVIQSSFSAISMKCVNAIFFLYKQFS